MNDKNSTKTPQKQQKISNIHKNTMNDLSPMSKAKCQKQSILDQRSRDSSFKCEKQCLDSKHFSKHYSAPRF